MAALAYPIIQIRRRAVAESVSPLEVPGLGTVVRFPARRRREARLRFARRRFVSALSAIAFLCVVWFGAGALAGLGSTSRLAVLPGSVVTSGGYRYLVRPGDTVWSIATNLQPTGDPRPLVDELEARWGGAVLHPGEEVVVP